MLKSTQQKRNVCPLNIIENTEKNTFNANAAIYNCASDVLKQLQTFVPTCQMQNYWEKKLPPRPRD